MSVDRPSTSRSDLPGPVSDGEWLGALLPLGLAAVAQFFDHPLGTTAAAVLMALGSIVALTATVRTTRHGTSAPALTIVLVVALTASGWVRLAT